METDWPEASEPASLSTDEAHVWAVSLQRGGRETEMWAMLSPEERGRAERFRVDLPRRQFTVARAALRTLLSRYLRFPATEIILTEDANGKPRLARQRGSTPLHFNVAHSNELALVAVAHRCEVGVDVERLRTVGRCEEIASRYFHDAESRAILNLLHRDRARAFLKCWTAKEAVLKAVGLGLRGSLAAFPVPIEGHAGQWLQVPVADTVITTDVWLQSLSPHSDYVAAFAAAGETRRVSCFTFQW
jgi:4'-phosphopantetheinyl transferase